MNHFTIDQACSSTGFRSGDRTLGDEKHQVGAGRSGFSRPVWPFLVTARREPECSPVPGRQDPPAFSS